jgi:hypothetical protein
MPFFTRRASHSARLFADRLLDMKLIAFYLPQFHRTPENDAWWGEGFTEWTNTSQARPLFKGHYQPRAPYQGKYYDLTLPEARQWQADIAREFGIYGFCYYHYWFKGRRLLYKPLDGILKTGLPDFPFCLSWANEPWTRAWDGHERYILVEQDYGDERDWGEHFAFLASVFSDPRYIKVDNKPLFIIYRPSSIPRCDDVLRFWNIQAKKYGWNGIHFTQMLTIFDNRSVSNIFEAQIEFEPLYTIGHYLGIMHKAIRYAKKKVRSGLISLKIHVPYIFLNTIDYDYVWNAIISRRRNSAKTTYLGAFADWDNTPRKKHHAMVIVGADPVKFKHYLRLQINIARKHESDFLFINAWNEWAEGAYLEPDERYGYQYLEGLYGALQE